ncbi:hypothetical protein VPH35_044578 [Triticum aestivum]
MASSPTGGRARQARPRRNPAASPYPDGGLSSSSGSDHHGSATNLKQDSGGGLPPALARVVLSVHGQTKTSELSLTSANNHGHRATSHLPSLLPRSCAPSPPSTRLGQQPKPWPPSASATAT